MGRNLGPLNIKDSYEGLVQISGSDQLTDGSGSLISSLDVNASTATSASYATTASFALNAANTTYDLDSLQVGDDVALTLVGSDASLDTVTLVAGTSITLTDDGSNNVTIDASVSSFDTGSLLVTGSVTDATLTFTKGDASTFPLTVNNVANAVSASHAVIADSALAATTATSASHAVSSDTSISASHAVNADSAISSSYATTASFAENVSTPNLQEVTDVGAITTNAITSSGAFLNGNVAISGDLDVNGTITYISSSTLQIGDNVIEINYNKAAGNSGILTYDTTSPFTASLLWDATADRWIAGPFGSEETIILSSDTGSMSVASASVADTATSASYATTASYAENVTTPTLQNVLDAGDTANGDITLTTTDNRITTPNLEVYYTAGIDNFTRFTSSFGELTIEQDTEGFNFKSTPHSGVDGIIAFTSGSGLAGKLLVINPTQNLITSNLPISASSYISASAFIGDGSGLTNLPGTAFPFTGSAQITGSLGLTGSISSDTDATINGITVGRGGGSVSTNTALGFNALQDNTAGGTNNTAVGYQALKDVTTGDYNTALGKDAGRLLTDGLDNIYIGWAAGFSQTNGNDNVLIGATAGQDITNADNNILIGTGAGNGLETGDGNTMVGTSTGPTTGGNNTIIGRAGSVGNISNNIILSDGAGNIAYQYDNASTTTTFSGTIKQDVSALTITSNTASLDASVANMFTLTLQNAADTHLELSNQVAGQNFILQIKNNATAAGTISFDSQFQFEGGTPFTATAATNALDILTFTSFGGNVQCVGSKNFS